jgi:hypothetical protein
LIIDGADAGRFALPHFAQTCKSQAEAFKIRLHLLGCIAHGRDTYVFTCPSHVAQGNNVTIQVMHEVFKDIIAKDGKLPDTLLLQLDNTSKQNKGRFLFAYCQLLVKWNVFKRVYISFLPVGHTHEDIDQFFSRISVYLRKNDAMSRTMLGRCIIAAFMKYGRRPIVKHWNSIANISGWLDKYVRIAKDCSLFYYYRFMKNTQKKTVCQARTWPGSRYGRDTTDFWRGTDKYAIDQDMFHTEPPSLLDALADMPPVARANHCTATDAEQVMAKKFKHVGELYRAFPKFTATHYKECQELLKMEDTPLEDDIPFPWTRSEIVHVYGEQLPHDDVDEHDNSEAAESEGDRQAMLRAPELELDKFYILRPNDDDEVNTFLLGQVKKVGEDGGSARVQYWCGSTIGDPARDEVHDPFHKEFKCVDTEAGVYRPYRVDELEVFPRSDFECVVDVVKYKKSKHHAKQLSGGRGVERMMIAVRERSKVARFVYALKGGLDYMAHSDEDVDVSPADVRGVKLNQIGKSQERRHTKRRKLIEEKK